MLCRNRLAGRLRGMHYGASTRTYPKVCTICYAYFRFCLYDEVLTPVFLAIRNVRIRTRADKCAYNHREPESATRKQAAGIIAERVRDDYGDGHDQVLGSFRAFPPLL